MKHHFTAVLCLLALTVPLWAQDEAAQTPDNVDTDTVTVSKQEFDALKQEVSELKDQLKQLLTKGTTSQAEPPQEANGAEVAAAPADQADTDSHGDQLAGGRALALPDISFITEFKAMTSSDKRTEDRNSLRLSEGELSIQGWIYPNVKADAFISMSPQEESAAQIEEGYVTYLGLAKGLNATIGRKKVSFGRTNALHSHSWPWVSRPLAFGNLVAEENLTGEGVELSYVIPTKSPLFAQIDGGVWGGGEAGESVSAPEIMHGPGAGFNGNFGTARLWTGYSITPDNELEMGYSYAEGTSEDTALAIGGSTRLQGVDVSFRHFGDNDTRLLLRGEQFWREDLHNSLPGVASGYYIYGDYAWNKYNSLGMQYSWSQFPQDKDLHESAVSLMLTHQFSEQYYLRLQGNHGWRPGSDAYNELWLMWVCGIGPHTHNLE